MEFNIGSNFKPQRHGVIRLVYPTLRPKEDTQKCRSWHFTIGELRMFICYSKIPAKLTNGF